MDQFTILRAKFEVFKEFPMNESDAPKIKPLRIAPPVPQMIWVKSFKTSDRACLGIIVVFRIWNTFKLVICGANVSIVQISFYHFI